MNNTYECNVKDLPQKNPPKKEVSKETVEKQVTFDTTEPKESIQYNIFSVLDNVKNIKMFLIMLLVYIILHSEILTSILANNIEFLASDGRINIIGNVLMFLVLAFTYFYLS